MFEEVRSRVKKRHVEQLLVLAVSQHRSHKALRIPDHVVAASTAPLLLVHFQVLDLNADVAAELLLFNILEHLLEWYGLCLLDVFKTFWFAILIIACVLISLYHQLILRAHDIRDQITDDILEELEFSPAFLTELSYVIAYQHDVLLPLTLARNWSGRFVRNHAYMSL